MGTGKNRKKYNEINVNEIMFGNGFTVFGHNETDESITLFMKSRTTHGICPFCGVSSDQYHCTYHRTLQTTPIRCKTTYLNMIAYKFNCINPLCTHKVFMEDIPFTSPSQIRTDELTCLILSVSLFMSNEGASTILREMGIKVSNDTIGRLYNRISIEDAADVEAVGIDDVAIRKGQTYATAIYDMADHHMIALLEGRDAESLRSWLKTHPKIKLVSRDRASAYANAISDILPGCTQVADRFHLLQNLIDRMKDIFKEELPANFYIKDGKLLQESPAKEKQLKIPVDSYKFYDITYDNSPPLDQAGNRIKFDDTTFHPGRASSKKNAENRKKNKKLSLRSEQNGIESQERKT